ncbi:hypothetical protein EMQ25_00820 [Arsenicitalea aurantiaca]|uniref:Uncharacterized protein n=1 Tax=Arsenicitalea aurantiaca TaxID=1783274 RepID=A0A433XKJ8_9HYPH|nr:hypothetical protein [Arsenicitalea aurantiaca]RUT34538.1 hypothetical protein EMQ25_00820 [Arsenicitalea aurantiaca]
MTATAAERRRALLEKIQTDGAEAAFAAALEVCLDRRAPAPARATCATTILRAGGYLNIKPEDGAPKEPHEMTAKELEARIAELRRATAGTVDENDQSGVFD